jgi:hypothetical protein
MKQPGVQARIVAADLGRDGILDRDAEATSDPRANF